jgi:hypothetical protein
MMEAALAPRFRPTRSARSKWQSWQAPASLGTTPPSLAVVMADFWRSINRVLFDPYRPELHYMRGPGPKWREKQAATHSAQTTVAD